MDNELQGIDSLVDDAPADLSRIEQMRLIVDRHQAMKIDGYLMDAFTASMLVKVYDAFQRPESRERFNTVNLPRLVEFGWGVMR